MESFIAERKEFAQSIQEDTSPPLTGIDGRIPDVTGIAAKKSDVEYRAVEPGTTMFPSEETTHSLGKHSFD